MLVGGVATWFGFTTPTTDLAVGIALPVLAGVPVLAYLWTGHDLPCDDSLTAAYHKSFMMRLALATAPPMIGFVGTIVAGSPWPYAVGLAFAVPAYQRMAPSRGNLARDQQRLAVSGCDRDLTAELLRN